MPKEAEQNERKGARDACVSEKAVDELSAKYGAAKEIQESTSKKRAKKCKVRPLDIEFPIHGNALTPSSDAQMPRDISGGGFFRGHLDEFPSVPGADDFQFDELLIFLENIFRDFRWVPVNAQCEGDKLVEFVELSDAPDSVKDALKQTVADGRFKELLLRSKQLSVSERDGKLILGRAEVPESGWRNSVSSKGLHWLGRQISSKENLGSGGSARSQTLCLNGSVAPAGDCRPSSAASRESSVAGSLTDSASMRDSQGGWKWPMTSRLVLDGAVSNNEKHLNCFHEKVTKGDEEVAKCIDRVHKSLEELQEARSFVGQRKLSFGNSLGKTGSARRGSLSKEESEVAKELAELRAENTAYKGMLAAERLRFKNVQKELLELRLWKAKTLAHKRIRQAQTAIVHAMMIMRDVEDREILAEVRRIHLQWCQILEDYKEWLQDLDKIVEAYKVLLDANNDFGELPLLTPPNHIQSAPMLSARVVSLINAYVSSRHDLLKGKAPTLPPPGFEEIRQPSQGSGSFGAIGEPTSSTVDHPNLTDGDMQQLADVAKAYLDRLKVADVSIEAIVNVIRDEARKLATNGREKVPTIINRAVEHFAGESRGRRAPKWGVTMLENAPRTVNVDGHECNICLSHTKRDDELLWCPYDSCAEPYHRACVIEWLKDNSTCPNCRRVWNHPDEFPSLSSASA